MKTRKAFRCARCTFELRCPKCTELTRKANACYFVSNDCGDYSAGYIDGRSSAELAARVYGATTVLVGITRNESEARIREIKN